MSPFSKYGQGESSQIEQIKLFDATKPRPGCHLPMPVYHLSLAIYGRMANRRKLMIVVGETSGDSHAAKLINALREAEPDTEFSFFGAAGPRMRQAGVEAVVRADDLSVVGLAEIGRAMPMFLLASRNLRRAARERRPDAVILVDFPEFNLKLAKALKQQGLFVIYYISPQLWAWRQYRISTVKKYVDLMITILPFEKEWYARRGVSNVEYVGSPLAREVHAGTPKAEFCRVHEIDPERPIIALLPGSRNKEISRILPVLIDAALEVELADPNIQFLVAAADERNAMEINRIISRHSFLPKYLSVIDGETYDLLYAADAAAVASGTATLEAGILGTPMVVVYRTSELNYRLFEPMIDVPHYGLINLIAEERIAVELIQHEFTPASTAAELLRLLEFEANAELRKRLMAAADKLGHGGASHRAAEAILACIDRIGD